MKRKIIFVSVGIVVLIGAIVIAAPKVFAGAGDPPKVKTGEKGTVDEGIVLPNEMVYTSSEDAVSKYIGYLSNKDKRDLAVANNYYFCKTPGSDPDSSWQTYMGNNNETQEEMVAAWRDGTKNLAKTFAIYAEHQCEFVKMQFGQDAWDKVTYEFEPWLPTMNGRDAYILTTTGEEITKEENDRLWLEFWNDIAAKEGLTYDDLFQSSDPKKYREDIRSDIVAEHIEEFPVKLTSVSLNTAYKVHLYFDGQEHTEDYGDFKFFVEGKDKEWLIVCGLMWEYIGPPERVSD